MTNEESESAFNARLARTIAAYWRARGHDVHVICRNEGFSPAMREAHVSLASTMKNGLPQERPDPHWGM